ncbi:hypothetical protein BRD10_01310 [Halobacteriales archaeon SW_12_71_31]|nr:MAG: hypothetical protein BRD10_01310 [Halobacteriales archaeon SW_12_71_31]
MKVDCWLYQPAGTPILTQIAGRSANATTESRSTGDSRGTPSGSAVSPPRPVSRSACGRVSEPLKSLTVEAWNVRLLLDAMCGGLRAPLRMCGHDTAYALDRGVEADDRLLALAREEERTLITRDRELARRVPDAVVVESHDVDEQLRELRAAGVDLDLDEEPTRCGRCNGRLERVGREDSDGERPAYVPETADPVWRCRDCGQRFWRGSHWADVRERLPDGQ